MEETKNLKGHFKKEVEDTPQPIGELKDSVSKGKLADEALKESEQIFRTIFENASDGILSLSVKSIPSEQFLRMPQMEYF